MSRVWYQQDWQRSHVLRMIYHKQHLDRTPWKFCASAMVAAAYHCFWLASSEVNTMTNLSYSIHLQCNISLADTLCTAYCSKVKDLQHYCDFFLLCYASFPVRRDELNFFSCLGWLILTPDLLNFRIIIKLRLNRRLTEKIPPPRGPCQTARSQIT